MSAPQPGPTRRQVVYLASTRPAYVRLLGINLLAVLLADRFPTISCILYTACAYSVSNGPSAPLLLAIFLTLAKFMRHRFLRGREERELCPDDRCACHLRGRYGTAHMLVGLFAAVAQYFMFACVGTILLDFCSGAAYTVLVSFTIIGLYWPYRIILYPWTPLAYAMALGELTAWVLHGMVSKKVDRELILSMAKTVMCNLFVSYYLWRKMHDALYRHRFFSYWTVWLYGYKEMVGENGNY